MNTVIHHPELDEPSYLVNNGSTFRMDWKSKSPRQFAFFFKCTCRL